MKGAACLAKECAEAPPEDSLFCAVHWKELPRWARVELVTLRNGARKRSKGSAQALAKAALVAAYLLSLPAERRAEFGPR
jgi:hypothetical protein